MKTFLFGALMALVLPFTPPEAASGTIQGRWFLDFDGSDGHAQLTMKSSNSRGNWTNSHTVNLADFRGLSRPSGTGDGPAHFALVRDAGTVSFDGQLDATGGSGKFTFAAAPGFAAAMARQGVGDLSEEQVFSAAVHDVSRQFLGELKALGRRARLLRQRGVESPLTRLRELVQAESAHSQSTLETWANRQP